MAYNASNSVAASAQDYLTFFSAQEWAPAARRRGGGRKGMSPEGRTLSRLNPSFGAEQTVPCREAALTGARRASARGRAAAVPRRLGAAGRTPHSSPTTVLLLVAAATLVTLATIQRRAAAAAAAAAAARREQRRRAARTSSAPRRWHSSETVASAPPDMSGSSSSSCRRRMGSWCTAAGSRTARARGTRTDWKDDPRREGLPVLSVMDLLPTNAFGMNTTCSTSAAAAAAPERGRELTRLLDAVATAVYAVGVHARLLVSHWAHDFDAYRFLQTFVRDGRRHGPAHCGHNERYAGVPHSPNAWNGSLEIGVFQVPGWGNTQGNGSSAYDASLPPFPPHSRVNHAKYLVTDRRVNIGVQLPAVLLLPDRGHLLQLGRASSSVPSRQPSTATGPEYTTPRGLSRTTRQPTPAPIRRSAGASTAQSATAATQKAHRFSLHPAEYPRRGHRIPSAPAAPDETSLSAGQQRAASCLAPPVTTEATGTHLHRTWGRWSSGIESQEKREQVAPSPPPLTHHPTELGFLESQKRTKLVTPSVSLALVLGGTAQRRRRRAD